MSGRGRPPGNRAGGAGSSSGGGGSGGKWSSSSSSSANKVSSSSRGSSPRQSRSSCAAATGSASPNRGRGQRGRPRKLQGPAAKRRLSLESPAPATSSTLESIATTTSTPPRFSSESDSYGGKKRKHRRPKFQDNPSAPEIVEKGELKDSIMKQTLEKSPEANGHVESVKKEPEDSLPSTPTPVSSPTGQKRTMSETDGTGESPVLKKSKFVEANPEAGVEEAVTGLVGDVVSRVVEGDVATSTPVNECLSNGDSEVTKRNSKSDNSVSNGGAEDAADAISCLTANLNKAVKNMDVGELKSVEELKQKMQTAVLAVAERVPPRPSPAPEEVRAALTDWLETGDILRDRLLNFPGTDKAMQKTQLRDSIVEEVLGVYEASWKNKVTCKSEPSSPLKSVSEDSSGGGERFRGPLLSCGFDRSKLLTQMEDKFAKETHNALKNKPVYKRRTIAESGGGSQEDGKVDNSQESSAPSKIVAMKEPGEMTETSVSPGAANAGTVGAVAKSSDSSSSSSSAPATLSKEDGEDELPPPVLPAAVPPSSSNSYKSTDCTIAKEEESNESLGDEKAASPPPSSSTATTSPSGSAGGTSSELTKSLRKVRVRRSRTTSASQEGGPTSSSDQQQQPSSSSQNLDPPTLEAEAEFSSTTASTSNAPSPSKVIRSRLLLSPKRHGLSDVRIHTRTHAEKVSQPLTIDIPENKQHHQKDSSNRRPLLMTPLSSGGYRTSKRPPATAARERVQMTPAIMTPSDAETTAIAVVSVSDVPTEATGELPHHQQVIVGPGASTPKLTLNGEVISTVLQPSLKTVIRLPKSKKKGPGRKKTLDEMMAEVEREDQQQHHYHHRKRKREDGADSSSSLILRRSMSPHSNAPEALGNGGGGDSADESTEVHVTGVNSNDSKGEATTAAATLGVTSLGRTRTPDSQAADAAEKLAESMVVPEKASSFNIHPERCCSDTCHYCATKFGILDTPLHVSQLKTPDVKQFASEYASITGDACLCDKCFRFIDRKAKQANAQNRGGKRKGEGEGGKAGIVRACLVRNCNREVTNSVSKRWLIRIKKKLSRKVVLNWDRVTKGSAKATFPLCHKHNALIESYSICSLCRRKLSVVSVSALAVTKPDELAALNKAIREDHIPSELNEQSFVCKHCKIFCNIKQQALDPDYLRNHKNHKSWFKDYRKKLYAFLGLDVDGYSTTESLPSPKKIHQVSQSDNNPTKITIKTTTLDVPSSGTSDRPSRKRKPKEFASPNSEARIQVVEESDEDVRRKDAGGSYSSSSLPAQQSSTSAQTSTFASNNSTSGESLEKCSVTIQFDLNTKKLWQDLHYPYGNYTSFFRHLILLEKYWRNGDLTLGPEASQKASVYIRSVKNRIDAYEGKHKRSEHDLSASTRPDLSIPAAPDMLHLPEEDDEDGNDSQKEREKTSSNTGSNKGKKDQQSDSTILKIPNFPMPSVVASSSSSTAATTTSPSLPTRIRVRKDLTHLGLMEANLMGSSAKPKTSKPESFNIADLVATKASMPAVSSAPKTTTANTQSNLLQLLNDPPKQHKPSASSSGGPLLGNTSLIAPPATSSGKTKSPSGQQSSNSQLFKSSTESGSSAIPLTFNNSIAEVLAAANKANKLKEAESAATAPNKPEVTITAKQKPGPLRHQQAAATFGGSSVTPAAAGSSSASSSTSAVSSMQKLWTDEELGRMVAEAASKAGPSRVINSPSPSGSVSVQKSSSNKQSLPPTSLSSINSSTGVSNISRIHPLIDMNKLLQSQTPGVAPHIVAQSTLPPNKGGSSSSGMAKLAPKPPGPLPSTVRPVQLSKSTPSQQQQQSHHHQQQGIQTVNKKSLNTVLDRLNVLKTSSSSGNKTSPSTSSSSSLVQQLQAPPMSSLKASTSSSTVTSASNRSGSGSSSSNNRNKPHQPTPTPVTVASQQQQQAALAALNPFGLPSFAAAAAAAASGGMVGQPMVQYPTWAQQAQAAQAALLMAAATGAAGMNMNQVQAAAAMQELVKMSMHQQQLPKTTASTSSARIRAPPPLTHMGRPPMGGGSGSNQKPKSD